MSTRVRSFSKVNLGLAVGALRGDGFHPLLTLYQTLALHDDVTVTARPLPAGERSRITLGCLRDGVAAVGVPQSSTGDAERNTAWRIVDGALRRLGLGAEVHIAITKRLPVQGGMGAGSANAAAALVALERELGLGTAGEPALTPAERLRLAGETGSDVPLFLLGGTVLGEGRGEVVSALPDVGGDGVGWPVVVALKPGIGVSTRLAFGALDRRFAAPEKAAPLTPGGFPDTLSELSHALHSAYGSGLQSGPTGITPAAGSGNGWNESRSAINGDRGAEGDLADSKLLRLVRTGIRNDFEQVAFEQHPSLCDLKQKLVGESVHPGPSDAVYAALSGSGAALFGIYRTPADARMAQQRVQRAGAAALLTQTLPRRAYWEQMFVD